MAELHPIVVHFHIASLALGLFTSILALFLTVFEKTGFFKNRIVKRIFLGRELIDEETCHLYTDKFEFVAFVFLVYGVLTLGVAGIAGFLDASGNIGIININLGNFFLGIDSASQSEVLSYKVIWSIIGTAYFLYAGVLRIYFVNYRKERLHSQHFLIWILHAFSQLIGYLLLTLVASVGAIIVFGGTLITDIPILGEFLPGGNADLLPIILISSVIIVVLTVFAGYSKEPPQVSTTESEEHLEHEVTLWPAALAFGTVFVALAMIQFTQGDELAALGFFWMFFVLLVAFIFNEAYGQKLFSKPKEGWVWLFLGSEVILFAMIIGTSFGLRVASGANWPDPSEVLNIPLTALNTFILIVSSFTMVKAVEAIQMGNPRKLRNYLITTTGLGVIFLSIQVMEYLALFHEGLTPTTNLFGSTFYIQTGLHGAHVFFGVLLMLFTTLRAHQGGFTKENHAGVELVGLYWHFVDLVWIILFTLVYLI
ncbi:MAG: cytochrome c oxidase subunit 3 [Candidatus Hodarchaeales archaeon]|jgi:heme/copper-type cytochrome/quinol oxidase subunit 3